MSVQRAYLATLFLTFTILGCSSNSGVDVSISSSEDDTVEPARDVIGFSAMNLGNPFFQIIADSLTAEASKHGYEIVTDNANRDVKTQAEHIDTFIANQVKAIVLNPTDRLSIGPAIKKANEAGIPVFTCDLQCVAEDAEIVAHVGTDNLGGGRLAGEAMVEALGESGGKVFIVSYPPANSCVLRVQGFLEVIEAHNKGRTSGTIDIVGEQDGGGETDMGFDAGAAGIQANPDLAAIFAINDPSALGAYAALEQAGKTDQVTIVAFDGQKEGKQAIKDGKIYADPIQFPDQMGRLTMQRVVSHFKGEDVEAVTLIPTKLYRKADADNDPELE